MKLIACHACHQEIPETADICPHCGAAVVKTRGLLTILFWAIAGALAGAVLAPLIAVVIHRHGRIDADMITSAVANGAVLGSAVGGGLGAFFWALFPYRTKPRDPAEKEPSDDTTTSSD
jgi:hypothetical protein